jgi:hypothetical protein
MCAMDTLVNLFVSMSTRQHTKCHFLVKWSTTTHIALQPFNQGRPVTKSIDMSYQGLSGVGRGHARLISYGNRYHNYGCSSQRLFAF